MSFKIGEQYEIFIINEETLLIELHDYFNLCFYRNEVTQEELNDMKLNPSRYI